MPLQPGDKFGPYELLAPIGAGGMGEVWKARDTRLDRIVATKFSQAQFSQRFEREARAIAALNHPNIAQIYDVGENYIVMEYVDGEPVRAPDDLRKLLDIAVQIADGLAAAHAAGFVHRDLKPDNILLTNDGRVKILDFGLAKQTSSTSASDTTQTLTVTNPGTVLGTVAYMSPEQARGRDLDARSDQFSFGLILYELAVGKRAFQRPSTAETMAAIIREEPEPLPASVPMLLCWTIERLLSKDANDRYASTRDLFAELRAMRGRISEISAIHPGEASAPRTKRVRIRFAMLAGLAVLVLAATFMAYTIRPAAVDASHFRFTPFAATSAHESHPAWSPDGKNIAYLETTDGPPRIMVKRVDQGTPPVAIAEGSLGTNSLSWSPDSERIFFTAYSSSTSQILSAARAGGPPVVILSGARNSTKDLDFYELGSLSPDGKSLALLITSGPQTAPVRRLAFSSPPGAPPKAVGDPLPCCLSPSYLAWSWDSSRVLVRIHREDSTSLTVMTPAGHSRLLLAWGSDMDPQFSWVRGSRYLVMSSLTEHGEDQGLRLLDSETGKMLPFLSSATPLLFPSVSNDGKRIAYVGINHELELLEIPLSGGPPQSLLPSQLDQHSIAFSPNRDEFAFVRLGQVIIHNRASGEERVLVSSNDFPGADTQSSFSWLDYSPDGKRIALVCDGCEKQVSVWIVPAAGGSPSKLAGGGDGGWGPSWSPDGQWIVYNNTHSGHMLSMDKLRVGSGDRPITVTDRFLCEYPAWSPSGDWILCPSIGYDLKLATPDGATLRDLGKTAGWAAWSRNGRAIYNVRGTVGHLLLERIDVATGRATTISHLPPLFRPSSTYAGAKPSVSVDDRSIAISISAQNGDIWILDGFSPPGTLGQDFWPLKR